VTTNELTRFGIHTTSAIPSNQVVIADDLSTFINQTVGGGGAVTDLRSVRLAREPSAALGKIDSSTLGTGHVDTWNLFLPDELECHRHAARLEECRRQPTPSAPAAR